MFNTDEFRRIVQADLEDKATDEEADILRADINSIRAWYYELTRLVRTADTELSEMNTEKAAMAVESDVRVRQRWNLLSSERKAKRTATHRRKDAIVRKVLEAKAAISAEGEDLYNANNDRLRRIETKLDRLNELLLASMKKTYPVYFSCADYPDLIEKDGKRVTWLVGSVNLDEAPVRGDIVCLELSKNGETHSSWEVVQRFWLPDGSLGLVVTR